MTKIRRRVVAIFGKFGKRTDFVLEPACDKSCKCDICKYAFWIEGELE